MIIELLKRRRVLIIVLVLFIGLKLPHLFYSFYWDESWPYASGVIRMYLNGPSLMPGAIDGELARGHPLMFHFLGGIWASIFGTSHVALHSFALFISVLFLISIYEVGLKLFDQRIAISALIFVAFQQIFFVQSSFVLLEVLTAFLGFISIYFYVSKKYLPAIISLTMLFYTKESGMIVGFVLGIDALFHLFKKNIPLKDRLWRIVAIGIPVLLIGVFFLIQKRVSGWYVLPLYSNGLTTDWAYFYEKFRESFKVIFRDDYRKYLYLLVVLLSLITAWKNKNWKVASLALAGFFTFLIITDKHANLIPGKILAVLFSLGFVIFTWIAARSLGLKNDQQKRFILLLAVFIICFSVFTALNAFFIVRYLLIALIPALFIAAVFFDFYLRAINPRLFMPALMVVLGIEAWSFHKANGHSDVELGAFDGIYVHQQVAGFLLQEKFQNKIIASEGYLQRIHLKDPYAGYIPNPADTFRYVDWAINDSTEIVIFDNIEPDIRYEQIKSDTNFSLIFRVEKGSVWGEIYENKQAKQD